MSTSAKLKARRETSRGPARPGRRVDLRRPFDAKVFARARELADAYQIVIRRADGEYFGEVLELPGIGADGRTPDECVKSVREALVASLAHLMELGHAPPAPAGEARTEQINLRLSPREKKRLESAAVSKGFRGIADYARATLLDQ